MDEYVILMMLCSAFLAIPPAQFKLVLDAIIWALKHTMRHVADTGLSILYQLLQNVAQVNTAAQSFYQTYYIDVLQHLFSVVTDSSHTAGPNSSCTPVSPRAGSGVVRMDPLRILAGCRTRRLNQA